MGRRNMTRFLFQINGQILYGRSHQNASTIINNAPSKVKIVLIRQEVQFLVFSPPQKIYICSTSYAVGDMCECVQSLIRNKAARGPKAPGSRSEGDRSQLDSAQPTNIQHVILPQVLANIRPGFLFLLWFGALYRPPPPLPVSPRLSPSL